jgi:hypothetical protein
MMVGVDMPLFISSCRAIGAWLLVPRGVVGTTSRLATLVLGFDVPPLEVMLAVVAAVVLEL